MKTLTIAAFSLLMATGLQASPLFVERLADVGITDAQKQQVKAVLRKHLPEVEPMIKQLVTERRTLRDTIHADQVDEKAIRVQAAKVARLEAELAIQRARLVHEIKPVLTPEQIEKLKAIQTDANDRIDMMLSRVGKRIAAD